MFSFSNIISFPGLGLSFDVNPVAFNLFGREIRWYGLILCLAIVAGFFTFAVKGKKIGLSFDDILDYAIFIIPSAIIGARLYFVLTRLEDYNSFYEIIAIWNGGIAIYGAIIGGFIALVLVSRYKKKPILKVLDSIAPAVLIGQIIGRWGNFVNAEAYGSISQYDFFGKVIQTPTLAENFPLRMSIANSLSISAPIIVHPTFLYESIWNFLGFILILSYYRHKKFDGEIVLSYLIWYGFGRCIIEGFRTDSLWIGSLRISQLLAAICVIFGLILLISLRIKSKKALVSAKHENVFKEESIIKENDFENKSEESSSSAENTIHNTYDEKNSDIQKEIEKNGDID